MKRITNCISYFKCGEELLEASIISDIANQRKYPNVVSLHGGGPAGKERIYYLAEYIAPHGYSTLSFDFSGHGNSTGELSKSSLEKRVNEAIGVIRGAGAEEPLTLIGTSMGGHIALELLSKFNVENLILFCPALYTEDAYHLRFDSGFTETIRKPNSFEDAHALKNLKNFSGNIFLAVGDNDEIIPDRVIDLYLEHSVSAKKKRKIILNNTPHVIHKWVERDENIKHIIRSELIDFLGEQ